MFERTDRPRLFALPPGADFPSELVRGIVERLSSEPPEALARVTLYLNTGRMLRAVRAAFDGHGARLLPRLRLVTDLANDPAADLPLPVPPLHRRLELTRLVAAYMTIRADLTAGKTALGLADSLARLLDEMEGEAVPFAAFEAPDFADEHARHWERSLQFLRIAMQYVARDGRLDPEGRRRQIVDRLCGDWKRQPTEGPVIVAGSTGSRGTTLSFMRAVASLPQGAVVLPGHDFNLPDSAWNSLDSSEFPAEDHPQYRGLSLARSLGMEPRDILPWRSDTAPDAGRNKVISLAMRPAPVSDRWLAEGPSLGHLPRAMQGVTAMEAPSPREEAGVIAAILRQAVESGRRAALITPDRALTRRVAAALDRWTLTPDDSAGQPLIQSAPGRFLRQVAALGHGRVTPDILLALLKHPLTATGGSERGRHLRFTRELELSLRRGAAALPDRGYLLDWASRRNEPGAEAWAEWVSKIAGIAVEPAAMPLARLVQTHLARAEMIAGGPDGSPVASELWRENAGALASQVMGDLAAAAPEAPDLTAQDYADLVASLLAAESVRQDVGSHPLIAIWGTLEARVQGADLVILAGLNEGVWPKLPDPDPWLSRQMRRKAGLLLPERQIGLSAHDFQQAAGAPEIVLSRALRDDETETVPSRWLVRIFNLLDGLPGQDGPAALRQMRDRGTAWLALARAAEAPRPSHVAHPCRRPSPRPPVEARPRLLPVTSISKLIRDPYAVYAERVLRLRPLDPLLQRPDARLRGIVMHAIMERFVGQRPESEDAEAAQARLRRTAEDVLRDRVPWPGTRRIYLAKLDRVAAAFIADEQRRAREGRPIVIESKGSTTLDLLDFTLTAQPDRIDLLNDGRIHIYDYKTGQPPSMKQQDHFDKQLRLEAAMAERGAFAALGPVSVAEATHIGLGSDFGEHPAELSADILAETWEGLTKLIAAYMRRDTGYSSRRAVFQGRISGDFDHLARLGEWEMSDMPVPEDVG